MNVFELYASITLNSDEYKSQLKEAESESSKTAQELNAKAVAAGALMAKVIEGGAKVFLNLAKTGITYNAQIESYTASLTTALGNEAAAAEAIEQIKDDAARTPYSVDGLVKANSYLIAAGESAKDSRQTILALTDAISATGGGNAELARMAQNLQQIKNTGKATTMDLRQFAMAGIDIYGILADYTGKTVAEVQELSISYDMVSGALVKASQEGGKYFEANARQAATFNGQISTLKDNVDSKLGEAFSSLAATISGKALPAANKFISGLDVSKAVAGFNNLVKVLGTVGAAVGAQAVADKIMKWVSAIQAAQVQLALLEMQEGAGAAAAAMLNGTLTTQEVIAGVLTGKISLATAAQYAWNAAVSAFPVAIIVAGLAAIGFAVADYVNDINSAKVNTDELSSSLEGLVPPETVNEAVELADQINKLQDQLRVANEQLQSDQLYGFTNDVDQAQQRVDELNAEIERLTGELNNIKSEAGLLTDSAETAAGGLDDLTGSAADLADGMAEADEATQLFTDSMDAAVKKYTDTYNKISKAVNGWFGLFDEAKVDVTTSIDDMMSAMQSQIEFNDSYKSNLATLRSYDLPELAAAFQDMGKEGSAYAAALVAAVEDAGGATSDSGQEIIQNFRELSQGVAESREGLSTELTNITGEFDSAFSEIMTGLEGNIADMDMSADAAAAAATTIQAYIAGIAAGAGPAGSAAASVAAAVAANLGYGPSGGSGSSRGSNKVVFATRLAVGSDYIPYDDYPALLHKGEMVVPAKISEDLRDFVKAPTESAGTPGKTGGLGEIVSLLQAILRKDSGVYLNGTRVSEELAPETDRALGDIDIWRGRGLSMA